MIPFWIFFSSLKPFFEVSDFIWPNLKSYGPKRDDNEVKTEIFEYTLFYSELQN